MTPPGGNDSKGELPGLGIEMLMGLLLETASVGHDAAINASVSVDQLCSDSDFGVYLIIRRRGSTSSMRAWVRAASSPGGIVLRSRGHSRRSLSRLQRSQVGLHGLLESDRRTPVSV